MKSRFMVGDGRPLNKADGEESWLKTSWEAGDTSRDPWVFKSFIDSVREYC